MGLMPVLWIYGPPGVGKSTVAWELFTQLPEPAGFVDIDQLGMCYGPPTDTELAPEPADDPGRYLRKERNLAAVAGNFARAGARGLVVSGIVDPVRGIDLDLFRHVALTPLRLRCEPAELLRRLGERNRPGDRLDGIAEYADQMDRIGLPGECLDSTGLDIGKTVEAVRDHVRDWPPPGGPPDCGPPDAGPLDAGPLDAGPPDRGGADSGGADSGGADSGGADSGTPGRPGGAAITVPGEIVFLCGPAAVGKSTAGWETYMQSGLAGIHSAFADLQQIGFLRPDSAGNHRLKAANLAAIWRTYRQAGARRLVVVGAVDHPGQVALYRAALPDATVTVCRLRAGLRELTSRALLRGQGQGPAIAGDTLAGLPPGELRRIAAAEHARDARHAGHPGDPNDTRDPHDASDAALGDLEIDTDGQTPAETAAEILNRIGDPAAARPAAPT